MNFRTAEVRDRILPIGLSQGFGVACGLIGVRIVSHLVPPEALGAYGVFLTFTTLGASLVHSGIVKFVGRNWAKHSSRKSFVTQVYQAWARKLPWLFAGTCAATIALQYSGRGNFFATFPALLTASIGLSIGAMTQTALQSIRRHWADLAVSAVGSVTRTFVPPIVYVIESGAMSGLYYGFCVHALSVAALGLILLRPRAASSEENADRPSSTIYEGPIFFMLALAGWTLTGLNRWVAVTAFGETVGGYYTLAANIAQIIAAVLGGMTIQYLQPTLYMLADLQTAEASRRLMRSVDWAAWGVAGAGAAALLLLRGVAPHLVGPLIDRKYINALEWIVPAGCFGLAVVIGQFYHVMLLAGRRERSCVPVDLTAAFVLVAGSIFTAWIGSAVYKNWLMATPIIILLLTRTMARKYYKTAAPSATAELAVSASA